MNENICVCLIVSETTWIRQELVIVQTFQDTHKVFFFRYPYNVLFIFHTLSSFSPASYHSCGSDGSANKSWSTSACRNAVCTSIETVMWFDSGMTVSVVWARSQHRFQRQRRRCWWKHLGLCTSLTSIVVFQDQPWFHSSTFSRSIHRVWIVLLPTVSVLFTTVIVPISFSEFNSCPSSFLRNHQNC